MDSLYIGAYWKVRKITMREYADSTKQFLQALCKYNPVFNELFYVGRKPNSAVKLLQDFDNAILNFKSYINAESRFAQAHYDLAICYKEKERLEEAITSFSQAIEINPKFELAYFERGLLKHKVNDKDGGCADLKKALELGYLQAGDFVSDLCEEKKL